MVFGLGGISRMLGILREDFKDFEDDFLIWGISGILESGDLRNFVILFREVFFKRFLILFSRFRGIVLRILGD